MAFPNGNNKSFTGPMGIIAVGAISIFLIIFLFGLTSLIYFIKFMSSDIMQTGIPVWVLLMAGFVLIIMNRNRNHSRRGY